MHPHRNNIGLLRLVLASLVIVGHAPEMLDGDRSREPLTALFHTLSLGEAAVDGFFLLSGYLIAGSMARTGSVGRYLARRCLRIMPAFAVASLICVFVLGPIVHADVMSHVPATLLNIVLLRPPMSYPGQFPGLRAYPDLDGSMWTIAYEFRCYLLVAALHRLGLLANRAVMLVLTLASILVAILATVHVVRWRLDVLGDYDALVLAVGRPVDVCRLTPIFMVGACFHLFRREVDAWLTPLAATGCVLVAAGLMYRDPHLAEASLCTFGAVTLFTLALKIDLGRIQRVNDAWDVSYGTYLYGWPIATLIRWLLPSITPWPLVALSLPCALAFGAASWWGLERWVQDLARPRGPSRDPLVGCAPADPERLSTEALATAVGLDPS